jgi:hypothetical protein
MLWTMVGWKTREKDTNQETPKRGLKSLLCNASTIHELPCLFAKIFQEDFLVGKNYDTSFSRFFFSCFVREICMKYLGGVGVWPLLMGWFCSYSIEDLKYKTPKTCRIYWYIFYIIKSIVWTSTSPHHFSFWFPFTFGGVVAFCLRQ